MSEGFESDKEDKSQKDSDTYGSEDDEKEESPFSDSSSEDDPFATIDGDGDFDPFLDYPGESNDIADPAPSQARNCCSLDLCRSCKKELS